jgi:hypothetical protein
MKLKKVMETVLGPHRYFYFGVKQAAKLSSGFTRERALDQAMSYVYASKLEGDYLEFGVWRGRAFSAACYFARKRGLKMNFYAFDSFCGFPENNERDPNGYKWFVEGVYKYSEGQFLKNVRRTGADMKRVTAVPGWFEDSLKPDNPLIRNLRKAAVVWIDCDLYSSTRTVLNFLTPYLQYGTLLLFDDWFAFLADPHAGQQRAFREWMEANPQLSYVELMRFGWCGNSFVIHDKSRRATAQLIQASQ